MAQELARQPRQERSKTTFRTLMRVARELWEAHGVDEISIDDICAKAGVARGTFYVYFRRKEHLLVMVLFYGIALRLDDLDELLASDRNTLAIAQEIVGLVAAKLRGFTKPLVLRAVEQCFPQHGELREYYNQGRSFGVYYEPLYRRGQDRGELSKSWSPELLAQATSWMILQGMLMWSNGSLPDAELERNLRHRVELIVNGGRSERTTT